MTNNEAVTYTPTTADQAVAAGYHNGSGKVKGDADLVEDNIRNTVTIFGVAGNSNVVNTSSGDAVSGDILNNKKAWVDGSEVTGNVIAGSDVNGADGSKTFTIPNGLYSGSKEATANDTNLTAPNIKDDVVIFGVTGTFPNDGNATTGEVKTGSTFYTNTATKHTGTGTKTLSAASDAVNAGYYAATTLSAVDADLNATNIKKDVDIFGKVGTYPLAGVEKTGQTGCWNTAGGSIDCAGTGQDGDLQKGVAWPNPRFTDNEDNTVTDNLTGLMWAQDANATGTETWSNALTYCNDLDLGGHTDWRLPNVKELLSLIDWAFAGPALSNDAGTDKWGTGLSSFSGVQSDYYWSSTTCAHGTGNAWSVGLGRGYVGYPNKTNSYYVWPVRGGQ
jgi:hypothetical protein